MPSNAYATAQRQMGIAIETVRGTGVAPAFWVPMKTPKWEPKINIIDDNTLQGSMVELYDVIRGQRYDAHAWNSFIYLDHFPVLVRCQLGSADTVTTAPANTTLAASCIAGAATVSSTATVAAGSYVVLDSANAAVLETVRVKTVSGAGPFTLTLNTPTIYAHANGATVTGLTKHQFSLLNNAGSTGNQPPSATLTDFDGEEWRQITAAQLDKLTLKATADAAWTYDCTWFGNPATTPSTPTPSYTTEQAAPGWTTQVITGTTQIGYMMDVEFDFARKVKPIPAFTGTQAYYQYFASTISPNGKISVVSQSGQPELAAYLNNTIAPLDLTTFNTRNGDAMTVHCNNVLYRAGSTNSGKEWLETDLDFSAIPNTTDALAGGVSPVLVTVANTRTTAY